jgi:hypothetical protein
MEWTYTPALIKHLSTKLDDSWKLIWTGENDLPSLEGHDPQKTIVFQISDEKYSEPSFHKNVKAVFKHYVKSDCDFGNVYPIPQGVMTGFVQLPNRKPKDRSIDVFFSGNWHTSRRGILEGLSQRLSGKCNVVFLENHCVSMVQPTYSHYMMDSKIVLDLSGALGPETYRFYEGLAAGCTVLSYQKPDNWIYRSNPSFVPDWGNLDQVSQTILELLSDEKSLEVRSQQGEDFFNSRYNYENVVENHILPKLY